MMEIEVPEIHRSQQDMDLIDILWRQDIDLGAQREVFDLSHRQKEHERRRQQELEEEKTRQLLREREKALLAQLQLDEETGEYIPRPPAPGPPQTQSSATPLEVSQNVGFTEEEDAMSFDDCMQLLAEAFPLVDTAESAPPCLDTTVVPAPSGSPLMMPLEQTVPPQDPLLPSPTPALQRTTPDLEQAWLELLSLPELQNCLTMQMDDPVDTTSFLPASSSPEIQEPNYSFYPMPSLLDVGSNTGEICSPQFINTFDRVFQDVPSPDHISQINLKTPQLNTNYSADGFCDIFYPNSVLETKESRTPSGLEGHGGEILSEIPQVNHSNSSNPHFNPTDIQSPSPGDTYVMCKQEALAEFPDSDSGVSLNTSPNASSPEKSGYGDGSLGFSDSDMDEMDTNPGSAESDYSEMFSLCSLPDGFQSIPLVLAEPGQQQQQDKKPNQPQEEMATGPGHSSTPFTKDKLKKRRDVRLSRDEQRAKALQIPFTVDMIINLPVDDFNEMMSKHQLSEAQLALVRDIRRRGKNKVAAQNCRKRKMENIVGLEYELDSLKEERERLQREKLQNSSELRQMKLQLSTLYLEVFSMLQDEEGRPYSPSEYSLQQTSDGSVFLVPRVKKTLVKSKDKHLSAL